MTNSPIRESLERFLRDFRKRNPNVPGGDVDRLREGLRERISNEPPPKIALIGQAGVGKSTTINALFDAGQPVGHTIATTMHATPIEVLNGSLIVYDMPGIDEGLDADVRHRQTYSRVLAEVDVALWVLDAENRAVAPVQRYLRDILGVENPTIANRIVIGLNKADTVYPGETVWIDEINLPDAEQEVNIQAREADVRNKIREALPTWSGSVVVYSAKKSYRLPDLFSAMLDAAPRDRQWILAARKALADFRGRLAPEYRTPTAQPSNAPVPSAADLASRAEALSANELRRISSSPEALAKWLRENSGGA